MLDATSSPGEMFDAWQRMANIETASRGRSSIRDIVVDQPFFHANTYIHLHNISQIPRSALNPHLMPRQLCPPASKLYYADPE